MSDICVSCRSDAIPRMETSHKGPRTINKDETREGFGHSKLQNVFVTTLLHFLYRQHPEKHVIHHSAQRPDKVGPRARTSSPKAAGSGSSHHSTEFQLIHSNGISMTYSFSYLRLNTDKLFCKLVRVQSPSIKH